MNEEYNTFSNYTTDLYAVGVALLTSILAYLKGKKDLDLKSKNYDFVNQGIVVDNIQKLMNNHSELYSKVLKELEDTRSAKFKLEKLYSEEVIKGIQRDRKISLLLKEIEELKEEIKKIKEGEK